ncbi:MAG: murein biosynthesis integral membrane protein MurJ [Sedimentisphaerales bacterium]|nr:murein biosynthesis integral membrane protein MurJ [Sedimentisphaerales bacterium]
MDTKLHDEHIEREHFFSSAKTVAVITLVSRVFGMLRDMAITSLGANRLTDAYGLAFQIPNLFRRLFGEGALTSAFVPVFTETTEGNGFEKACRLFSNAFALLAVALTAIMVIVEIIFLITVLLPGPEDRKLLMVLAAIMFPYMVTVCLLAMGSAALNCRGHFAYPAAAPIILNIFGIVTAWWLAPILREDLSGRLVIVAVGVTSAGVVQLAAVLWLLGRSGFSPKLRLKPVEEGIGPMLKLLAPVLLGLGFLQISELLATIISWNLTAVSAHPTINIFGWELQRPLTEGVIVRVNAARALYQFPMGVLAIPVGVAVFPLLTRYAARGDIVNLRSSINRALRLALMEGISTGVGMFILAEPIVKLIYARRNFTAADAAQSAFILKMYAMGMAAYCSYQILTRAFYSFKDTVTPLKISCWLVLVNLGMLVPMLWVPSLGAGAFGLSTAITFTINAVILMYLLRKRLGLFGGRKILISVARTVVGSAVMAGVVYLLREQLGDVRNWVVVAVCVPAGAISFFAAVWLLRAPELGELMGGIKAAKERETSISQQGN